MFTFQIYRHFVLLFRTACHPLYRQRSLGWWSARYGRNRVSAPVTFVASISYTNARVIQRPAKQSHNLLPFFSVSIHFTVSYFHSINLPSFLYFITFIAWVSFSLPSPYPSLSLVLFISFRMCKVQTEVEQFKSLPISEMHVYNINSALISKAQGINSSYL